MGGGKESCPVVVVNESFFFCSIFFFISNLLPKRVPPCPLTGWIRSQSEALAGPPGFWVTRPALGGSGLRSLKADCASRPYPMLAENILGVFFLDTFFFSCVVFTFFSYERHSHMLEL